MILNERGTESFMFWWKCSKGPSKPQAPPLLSPFNYSLQWWVWHLQSFSHNGHHPEIPSRSPTARLLPRCTGEWQRPGRVGVHLASTCHSLPQNWGSWCHRHSLAFLVVFLFCQPRFWSLNRWVKAEKMVKANGGSWSHWSQCLLPQSVSWETRGGTQQQMMLEGAIFWESPTIRGKAGGPYGTWNPIIFTDAMNNINSNIK